MVHGLIVAVERKNDGGLGLVGSGRVGSRRVASGTDRFSSGRVNVVFYPTTQASLLNSFM